MKQFTDLFNTTTAKCYWDGCWHHPIEREEGVRVTRFFEQEVRWGLVNGIRVKGHPLVRTIRKGIPTWMDKYPMGEQMKRLENHVRSMIKEDHWTIDGNYTTDEGGIAFPKGFSWYLLFTI